MGEAKFKIIGKIYELDADNEIVKVMINGNEKYPTVMELDVSDAEGIEGDDWWLLMGAGDSIEAHGIIGIDRIFGLTLIADKIITDFDNKLQYALDALNEDDPIIVMN